MAKRKAKAIRALEKTKAFTKQHELQELCATAYQVVGAAGGPVELLDNLSAASVGTELPHNTEAGLPWMPAHDIATDKDIKTLKDTIEKLDLSWRTGYGEQYAARSAELKSLKHILEIISK